MQTKPRTKYLAGLGVFAVALIGILAYNPLNYVYHADGPPAATFDEFLNQKLAASKAVGARPANEERLVRFSAPGEKTKLAILYIHGFGASRGEGEAVVDVIAKEFQANTYYMRLPGHGANKEDHARTQYTDYIDAVEEAFAMMPQLGERTIIIGASTGGLLGTYLASKYPDRVYALIMASPFYEFKDPASAIFTIPGGMLVVNAAFGEIRDAGWPVEPENRKQPGYEDHWLTTQYYSALKPLAELRKYIVDDDTFGRITSPSLMLYYYKDETHQDESVDVAAMLAAFAKFGTLNGGANPNNQAVAIADGNHILLSEFVRTDKTLILNSIRDFLHPLE